MRRIAVVGALVGVVAVVSGCWAFGSFMGASPASTPAGGSVGSIRLEYRILPNADQSVTPAILDQTRAIIEARLNATDVADVRVEAQGSDLITVELTGVVDANQIRRLVAARGQLDFVGVPDQYASLIVEGEALPDGMDATPIFSGDQVSAARPVTNQSGELAVDIEFKEQGSNLFDEYAAAHVGERFAIVLDGTVISAPTINATSFNGRAQVSGSFTSESMNELVTLLKFGRLPLRVEEVSVGSPDRPPDAALESAQPTPWGSPWTAGSVVIVQLHGPGDVPLTSDQLAAAQSVVGARLSSLVGAGASVRAVPDDRLRIELARSSDADAVKRVATAPGILQFVHVPGMYADAITDGQPLPSGMVVVPLFSGDGVAEVSIGTTMSGEPAVDIVLTPAAARAFDEYASEHLEERFAMVLDGTVLSAPTIHATEFNGRAQISGSFDLQSIMELVAILHGTLPVAAEVLTVCPATEECPAPGPSASPATSG